ncbi:MAG: cell wall-associated hydrolase, invasion-associated protein [Eubacterium sp.]|jgi:cell wall-associated NlpC family hydrolase|nr:cell wall-associated hydrolase, invasion-associated protein [Eubacterium sp.]
MNKKLIASGIALTLCLTAIAPVYKSLSPNREILEPTTLQQVGTQATQDLVISESDTMKAEALAKNSVYTNSLTAVKTASTTTASTNKAAAPKKAVSSPAKKTASTAVKSTTSTVKKKTAARTSTSRGSTLTASRTTAYRAPAASSKASAVIATAKNYIGVPYVWGGESPSGFDCSGFTQYVLKKNGISIPRVTSDQYNTGTSVSKSNLKVGDLVFFTTYKAGPSHVGFYMGNGKFIHASSSKGVTTSSLDSSYYSSRYIGARRVIN